MHQQSVHKLAQAGLTLADLTLLLIHLKLSFDARRHPVLLLDEFIDSGKNLIDRDLQREDQLQNFLALLILLLHKLSLDGLSIGLRVIFDLHEIGWVHRLTPDPKEALHDARCMILCNRSQELYELPLDQVAVLFQILLHFFFRRFIHSLRNCAQTT